MAALFFSGISALTLTLMVLNETGYYLQLLKRILFLLFLYSLARLLFLIINFNLISDPPVIAFIQGIRFDLSALAFLNMPYILFFLQPFRFRYNKVYQKIIITYFILINLTGLFWNIADFEYFKFTLKRTTWDVFQMDSEISGLAGRFLVDFWYLPLIFIAFTVFLLLYIRRTGFAPVVAPNLSLSFRIVVFLAGMGITIFAARGGLQLKPLHIIHAGTMVPSQYIPVVLNTPFTLLKTFGETSIIPPIAKGTSTFDPVITFNDSSETKKNVVIIILESFGTEYTSSGPGHSFTPFLDSLMQISEYFPNSFANGKKSVEGIPSIIASIPSWSEIPFASSNYSTNQFNSLATVLGEKGYHSVFYHGAKRGSMNLDSFSKLAGFDEYKGMEDYPNVKDHFDGHWGIFDEPYLDYFHSELNQLKQPFLASVFTLSSHHPYVVPDSLKEVLPEGKLPIHQSVAYTDQALRKWMNKVSGEPWFENTLFVITADHTGPSSDSWYAGRIGMYRIPILFFEPGKSGSIKETGIDQMDIFPMVLERIGFQGKIFSFGRKTGESKYTVQYLNGLYQILDNEYLLLHDGESVRGLFNFKSDPGLKKDLVVYSPEVAKRMEKELSSILTAYFNSLTQNKMTP